MSYTESYVLRTWEQAGERPFDLITKLGMEEALLSLLTDEITETLYRGTPRNICLGVCDEKVYGVPTSWSLDKEVASCFVGGCKNRAIIVIENSTVYGARNYTNLYGEKEIILAPVTLKVVAKSVDENGITIISAVAVA